MNSESMILKIVLAISLVLIGGCASISEKQLDSPALNEQATVISPGADEITEQLDVSQSALDPEVLYLLLTAELAGQKGQFEIALEGYLRAARKVNDPRVAERAVKVALYLKAYPQAQEAIDLWLKNDEQDLMARKVAAMLALMNGEKAVAVKHLDVLLTTDPAGFETAMFEIVKSLEREGKIELVFEVLEELSVKHPEQAAIYFVQSVLAVQQKKPDLALQKVQKTLILQPDWNKAVMLQAQIVASSGDTDRAESILTEAIEEWPENLKLKVFLARVLVRANKFDQAVDMFEQVIERDPEDLESQYALSLLHLQLQQDDKASKIFLDLVGEPEWSDRASFQLGRLAVVKGDFKRARVWFDKITHGPYLFDAKMATAGLLLDQKQYQEVEQYLGEMSFDGQSQELRLVLIKTELLSKQKRYSEAYDLLTVTLQKMHNQKELLYTRALIAEHLDRIDVLENDLQTILKEHPNDASALNALGYTLVDRGERLEEAEGYLSRALQFEPNEPGIIDSYGWLLFRQGKYDEALGYLQKAYEKEQQAEIAGHLVEVLWVLEQKHEARELYQDALQRFDNDEYLLRLKHEIQGLSRD